MTRTVTTAAGTTHYGRARVIAVAVIAAAASTAVAVTALPARADLGAPAGTQTRTVTRDPRPAPHLIGIRTGRHADYDRVVLDLSGAASGYKVGYVKTVRQDGSGKVIDMKGEARLLIRLLPADAHNKNGSATYAGPHKFSVDDPQLRQVAFAGDFEGTVSIALGLRHRAGFRVLTLANPTRIVVDVAH